EHILVTNILADYLADYARDNPSLLTELLMVADPKAYAILFPVVERKAEDVRPAFLAELAKPTVPSTDEAKDRLAERQARAAVALLRLGPAEEVWPRLRHGRDPRLRSFIVNWLSPLGADPHAVAAELVRRESPDPDLHEI